MTRFRISPPIAALILAFVLFVLSGLLPNGYGSNLRVASAQLTNIVRLSVFLGVIAAGQTLVIISGSEGIDLSAGSIVTMSAILTYFYVNGRDDRVLVALLIALATGALIGLLNGLGVMFLKISPFVMTLGMSGVVTGGIIVINNRINQLALSGKITPIMTRVIARPISQWFPDPVSKWVPQIPGAIVIWLVFGVLMWLLLERTAFGKHLFAIGVNRVTARLSGVNVTLMGLGTYTLAGLLAGFGGFLVVGNTGVVMIQLGQPFLFPSIAAVAVGGTLLSGGEGSYWGTMAGAIVLTLITSLLTTMQMPESVRRMVLGATLLVLISIYGRQRALRQ
jgi:ribose transport system permease protein